MDPFATSHLSNKAVLHELKTEDAHDRRRIAVMLSRLAEAEDRKLYLEEGYSSMHSYCVHDLHWCEGTASWRIYAARAARQFPVLFVDIAEGRLHLTAVVKLARHLTSGNLDDLRRAATHKSKAEIVQLLAERFPQPDVPELLRPIAPPQVTPAYWPANTGAPAPAAVPPVPAPALERSSANVTPGPGHQYWPANSAAPAPRALLKPIAPERFEFRCTLGRKAHDLLHDVRALLSHEIPTGEAALVLERALEITKAELLKRKHGVTDHPRRSKGAASSRRVSDPVKRVVWARDGGQCTFVSENGRRCDERDRLHYDHVVPFAQGGKSTVENTRLLCQAHNQHAAERAFGREFMERKRAEGNQARRIE